MQTEAEQFEEFLENLITGAITYKNNHLTNLESEGQKEAIKKLFLEKKGTIAILTELFNSPDLRNGIWVQAVLRETSRGVNHSTRVVAMPLVSLDKDALSDTQTGFKNGETLLLGQETTESEVSFFLANVAFALSEMARPSLVGVIVTESKGFPVEEIHEILTATQTTLTTSINNFLKKSQPLWKGLIEGQLHVLFGNLELISQHSLTILLNYTQSNGDEVKRTFSFDPSEKENRFTSETNGTTTSHNSIGFSQTLTTMLCPQEKYLQPTPGSVSFTLLVER